MGTLPCNYGAAYRKRTAIAVPSWLLFWNHVVRNERIVIEYEITDSVLVLNPNFGMWNDKSNFRNVLKTLGATCR